MRRTIPNPKPNNRFLYLSLLIAVLVIGFKLYKQHLRGTSVSETGALPGSLQFSPDSRLLAYVDGGGVRDPMSRPQNRLLLWSFQAPPRVLFATNGLISRPQFSHDGTLVASVCIDPGIIHAGTPALLKLEMIVKIWNVKSGALVRSLDAGSEPNAAKLWFTPDDKHLIVIGSVTKSFDLATGNVARSLTLPGECMQAEFSEADNLLLLYGDG